MTDAKDQFRKQTGQLGEQAAVHYLVSNGYQIVTRNWRCRLGEIDIVAKTNNTLVFIEVRSKRSSSFGNAESSITLKKQLRMQRLAYAYLRATHDSNNPNYRIDLLAIDLDRANTTVRHYPYVC
jgi:putative endonuclease